MRCTVITAKRVKSLIVLWLRCPTGKVKVNVHGFKPYFYIPSKLGSHKSVFGESLDKIVLNDPSEVPKYRSKYQKTYEADIPYTRRFFIDLGIYTCIDLDTTMKEVDISYTKLKPCTGTPVKPVVWFFDIEVYTESGLPSNQHPVNPIIAMSIYDDSKRKFITWSWHKLFKNTLANLKFEGLDWEVRAFDNEELMLMDFVAEIMKSKPDIVAGWNVGFDRDYLMARLSYLKLAYKFDFFDWFDMLEADKYIVHSRRGRSLKHVTVEEGIESKNEAKEASDILPLWKEKPVEVIKYNVRDVWRLLKLNEKYKYIETFWAYKEVTGLVHLDDTLSTLKVVDIVVLRTAKDLGIVLPTSEEKKKRYYKGALVLQPTPGIYDNVAVFDMSKYYPSIMISFNTSPEVKLKLIDKTNNIWFFRQDRVGIIPLAVQKVISIEEMLRNEQAKYKPEDEMFKVLDRKIQATKGVRNAFYGALANEHFRLYDPDVASTVTGLGREGIMYLKHVAETMGYKVMYGDTDSIFIQVPFDKAEWLAELLASKVRNYFKVKYSLRTEPIINLKFEKYYRRILFTEAKKRYAGWLVWKKGKETDKIDVVGFEAVRTDTAPFTAYAQEKVMELILKNGFNPERLNTLIKSLLKEFRESSLDNIALYASLTKNPEEYVGKTKPPHVRAVIYSNMYLGTNYKPGDKVKYIWVKRIKGLPQTDVVAFDDETKIRDIVVVDYDKMEKRVFWSPLERIFKSIGYAYGMSSKSWW